MEVPIEVLDKILPAVLWFLNMAEDGAIETCWSADELNLTWERADWAYHELKKARESIPVGNLP